jgi:Tfp pilus assembly protein PilX
MNISGGKPVHRAAQRGISMFITLIAVVLLTFAGLALMRSVDTSTLITGNMSFQEGALASAGAGTEAAITWLGANATGTTLFSNINAAGYYASDSANCDLTGSTTPADATNDVKWGASDPGGNCAMDAFIMSPAAAGVGTGYTVAYVINRMCNAPGDPNSVYAADGVTPMICSQYLSLATATTSTRVGATYGSGPLIPVPQHYYRITTRVSGPRNTVRFTQAIVVM